jgi:hypothetical protein
MYLNGNGDDTVKIKNVSSLVSSELFSLFIEKNYFDFLTESIAWNVSCTYVCMYVCMYVCGLIRYFPAFFS